MEEFISSLSQHELALQVIPFMSSTDSRVPQDWDICEVEPFTKLYILVHLSEFSMDDFYLPNSSV